MKCLNCNLSVPDGAEVCPFCNAKLNNKYCRCQNCFKIINPNTKVCPNCGTKISDADVHLGFYKDKEQKTTSQRLKGFLKNNLIIRILIAVFAVVIALSTVFGLINAKKSLIADMEKYQVEITQNMENIKALAQEYNSVYDGEWLTQSDNVNKVEQDCADTINDCKASRTAMQYMCKKIEGECKTPKAKKIIKDYYDGYEKCYLYVVEKHGTYPGYMTGFEKEYAKFVKSEKKCKEYLKELKK